MDNLNTGDILLFKSNSKSIISKVTHSPYTHAAIVVKDPWWSDLDKGLYVIQSLSNIPDYRDVETNNYKSGVQMEKLETVIRDREVDVRYIYGVNRDINFKRLFQTIYFRSFNKPYDRNIIDWIKVGISNLVCKSCRVRRHSNNFWCSALVGYFYTELGWLSQRTDWSNLSPGDLSKITAKKPYVLGRVVQLKIGNMYVLF